MVAFIALALTQIPNATVQPQSNDTWAIIHRVHRKMLLLSELRVAFTEVETRATSHPVTRTGYIIVNRGPMVRLHYDFGPTETLIRGKDFGFLYVEGEKPRYQAYSSGTYGGGTTDEFIETAHPIATAFFGFLPPPQNPSNTIHKIGQTNVNTKMCDILEVRLTGVTSNEWIRVVVDREGMVQAISGQSTSLGKTLPNTFEIKFDRIIYTNAGDATSSTVPKSPVAWLMSGGLKAPIWGDEVRQSGTTEGKPIAKPKARSSARVQKRRVR